MPRAPAYTVRIVRWLSSDNAPMRYYEVSKGDNSRDYMMLDYRPQASVGKFRTMLEAETFILGDGGTSYYSGISHTEHVIKKEE